MHCVTKVENAEVRGYILCNQKPCSNVYTTIFDYISSCLGKPIGKIMDGVA